VGSLTGVDPDEARTLLQDERRRVEELLDATVRSAEDDREAANDQGDLADPAQGLNTEQVDDAIADSLRDRLAAIERAEQRLSDGSYGRSVRSGDPIPDERLRADPAAELTVEEAQTSD
jgi:RNA polymerase-binding transcription factor